MRTAGIRPGSTWAGTIQGGRTVTWIGTAAAIAGLALAAAALMGDPASVLRAWFVALLTLGAIPIGCLSLLIVNHLLRRDVFLARVLEAGCRGLWPVAIGFVPVALFPAALYPWTSADFTPTGPLQEWWLDPGWFAVRAAVYFAVWLASAAFLIREERVVTPGHRRTGPAVAAALLYAATASFASLDWVMTLNPAFSSAGFGWIMAAHGVAAALGFAVLADDLLTDNPEPPAVARGLMVGGVLIWAFFVYMEWMVIWSGNVPELSAWYLARSGEGWSSLRWLIAGLMVVGVAGALAVPLWPRKILIRAAALSILTGQMLEGIWQLLPAFGPVSWAQAGLVALALTTIGGVLAVVFLLALSARPEPS